VSSNLERLSQGLELCDFLTLQLGTNLFETPDGFRRIQPFTASQADLSVHDHYGSVRPTPQEFLNLLLYQFPTAHRTLLEGHHLYLLVRQSIHRLGSGRYTVMSTAQPFSLLYAQTLWTGSPRKVSP